MFPNLATPVKIKRTKDGWKLVSTDDTKLEDVILNDDELTYFLLNSNKASMKSQ